jgi:hypothetical protein
MICLPFPNTMGLSGTYLQFKLKGSRRQAAGSMRQAAGSRRQAAGSRRQAAGSRQQATVLELFFVTEALWVMNHIIQ